MARYKGVIIAGIQPLDYAGSQLAIMSETNRSNQLMSANKDLRYQLMWNGLKDDQAPSSGNFNPSNNKGDIINVIFEVYATTVSPPPAASDDWDLVASITKTRDIVNQNYLKGQPALNQQRFTVDISSICQDLLSYSLVPINKGTWQSSSYGGMNGGLTKQDNVTEAISNYNVTPNGTYRHIWVKATPEVIIANGTIQRISGQNPLSFNKIVVINSLAQFELDNPYYYRSFLIGQYGTSTTYPRGFMSFCPNKTQLIGDSVTTFMKNVRTDEEAEWLYWYQYKLFNNTNSSDYATKARIKVLVYSSVGVLQNTCYLSDFNSNLLTETRSDLVVFKQSQGVMCAQNVSPVYINANAQDDGGNTLANQIDSSTQYYKTHLEYTTAEDNLVVNGNFASGGTSWNTNPGWTITTGEATSAGAAADINQGTWSPASGQEYMVTFTIKSISLGGFRFQFGGVLGTTRTTTGTFTEIITTVSTDRIRIFSISSANGVVTDIQVQKNPTTLKATEDRYFNIDRETANIPFGFVRFHWLNRAGAVDSYTAKRNVMEGLSVSRDTIETKSADRTWYQNENDGFGSPNADSAYINNTMRGGNLYKGGREVLNVNAQRNNSVYTEPLNKQTADWLEEIMTSPNVWIEMDTEATARGNTTNPFQRPSTKGYIPVIITNGEVETVNQEEGLVKFNIEYTLAHKVQTQRN